MAVRVQVPLWAPNKPEHMSVRVFLCLQIVVCGFARNTVYFVLGSGCDNYKE